jgi:ribonuclease HI
MKQKEDVKIPTQIGSYEAYTDGSHKEGQASWAFVILKQPGEVIVHEAYGMVLDTESVLQMWNVAGEIEAAIQAIKWAIDNKSEIKLISDYMGIKGWAEGWKTNNPWSEKYAQFVKENKNKLSDIIYVKAHSKNKWNNYVDKLASKPFN